MQFTLRVLGTLAAVASASSIRASTYTDAKCKTTNANTYVSPGAECATLTVGTMGSVIMSTSDESVSLQGYSTIGCEGTPAVAITTSQKKTCIDLTGKGILSWKGIF